MEEKDYTVYFYADGTVGVCLNSSLQMCMAMFPNSSYRLATSREILEAKLSNELKNKHNREQPEVY